MAPFIDLSDRDEDIFRGDDIIAEYEVVTAAAGIARGLDLRDRGEWRLGLLLTAIDAEVGIGDPDLPTLSESTLGVQLRYGYDQLDNANFPTAGSAFSARLYATDDTLGAEQAYSTLTLQGLKALGLSCTLRLASAKAVPLRLISCWAGRCVSRHTLSVGYGRQSMMILNSVFSFKQQPFLNLTLTAQNHHKIVLLKNNSLKNKNN